MNFYVKHIFIFWSYNNFQTVMLYLNQFISWIYHKEITLIIQSILYS